MSRGQMGSLKAGTKRETTILKRFVKRSHPSQAAKAVVSAPRLTLRRLTGSFVASRMTDEQKAENTIGFWQAASSSTISARQLAFYARRELAAGQICSQLRRTADALAENMGDHFLAKWRSQTSNVQLPTHREAIMPKEETDICSAHFTFCSGPSEEEGIMAPFERTPQLARRSGRLPVAVSGSTEYMRVCVCGRTNCSHQAISCVHQTTSSKGKCEVDRPRQTVAWAEGSLLVRLARAPFCLAECALLRGWGE
ncbi:unnamed protein product [Protopolystoma xenopodis]|uniref:Uncharacterized protein n=1 Tax=Protopolystoma xenopodis TaxID=117903 RepID=A0A448XJ06_9PLAT|nr:unnamed protein product [Protopolystoma xenopodis]